MKVIGDYAFQHCTSLQSIQLPDSITSIGIKSFAKCERLSEITLGKNVKSLGDYAFWNCTKLRSFTAKNPDMVYGKDVFLGCPWPVVSDEISRG